MIYCKNVINITSLKIKWCSLLSNSWWILGVSTGRAGSVFDPARTRPSGGGWKNEWPESNRWRQSVELFLGSGGGRVCLVGFRLSLELQNHHRIYKILPKSATSSPKNAKTHLICIKIAEINTKIIEICWKWPNLVKSHQIWLRTC